MIEVNALTPTTGTISAPTPSVTTAPVARAATRAWEDVLAHIERELLAGTLLPGDHLPSERTLATELGVGRSSVREALRVLEVLGLLRTQTGSGPESGAIIIARPSGGMSSLIRLQVAAQGFRVDDVVSTRLILETAIAAQLAESVAGARRAESVAGARRAEPVAGARRAEPVAGAAANASAPPPTTTGERMPDLSPALELLDAMEAGDPAPPEFLALDAQFHFSLAMAAGNQVIAATMTGLRDSIESYSIAGVANLTSWQATAARLKREHRAIVAAIESGDSAAARAAVNSHITGYYAEAGFGHPQVAADAEAVHPRLEANAEAYADHSQLAADPVHPHPTDSPEPPTKGTTHG
ncbi:FadR/GntR family transcriptional regulator [Subtercola endophyticus]|uniref:FadR/GntR family transcriptional regulator n=1 Tax=Subtercola endophyticus TaxID=2895559 RepID=UPI001E3E29F2|nr:FCD domain-containing protein [Subtercola endophyticus]UFS58540.1 FCD domain-containing protein [Subtercola endophyticus]